MATYESWKKAVRAIRAENRLQGWREKLARKDDEVNRLMTKSEEELLLRRKADLEADPQALALLPYAKAYVEAEDRRQTALENSVLGAVFERVENTLMEVTDYDRHAIGESDRGPDNLEAEWLRLLQSVTSGQPEPIFESLFRLLILARNDLLHRELPPVPYEPPLEEDGNPPARPH